MTQSDYELYVKLRIIRAVIIGLFLVSFIVLLAMYDPEVESSLNTCFLHEGLTCSGITAYMLIDDVKGSSFLDIYFKNSNHLFRINIK